MMVGLHKN